MLNSRRLRTVLAIDVIATVTAGVLLYLCPGLLGRVLPESDAVTPLEDVNVARWLGFAVATFGVGKGSLYAVALRRYGDEADGME